MSLRKSVIALAMTAAMIFPAGISASSNLIVEVNGEVINAPMSYISEENRTMVPIALISDSLGYEVNWDSNERTATFSGEDVTVVNKIGENFILLNGEKIIMDSPSVIKEGRTMVPLNAISTALGADVSWDAQTRTVIVKEKMEFEVIYPENITYESSKTSDGLYLIMNQLYFLWENGIDVSFDLNLLDSDNYILETISVNKEKKNHLVRFNTSIEDGGVYRVDVTNMQGVVKGLTIYGTVLKTEDGGIGITYIENNQYADIKVIHDEYSGELIGGKDSSIVIDVEIEGIFHTGIIRDFHARGDVVRNTYFTLKCSLTGQEYMIKTNNDGKFTLDRTKDFKENTTLLYKIIKGPEEYNLEDVKVPMFFASENIGIGSVNLHRKDR